MQTQQTLNYAEEAKKLTDGGDYWKPTPDKYAIVILEEPTSKTSSFKNDKGEFVEQLEFLINVNGDPKPYKWTVNKGVGKKGLYGQLMIVGAKLGKLKGVGFNLLVAGEDKKRSYTVQA